MSMPPACEHLIFLSSLSCELFGSSQTTSTTGSNKTNLSSGRRVPPDCGGLSNMLMVTTTMRMLHRVHSHTTNFRPAVPLCLVLKICTPSFQQGLVNTTSTSNDSHNSPVCRGHSLLGSRRKFDPSLLGILIVGNNCGVIS